MVHVAATSCIQFIRPSRRHDHRLAHRRSRSTVTAFTNAAFNALKLSNPTLPLPPEYPADQASFTVTFHYNEGIR